MSKKNVKYAATVVSVGVYESGIDLQGTTLDLRTDAFRRRYFVEELCRVMDKARPGMIVVIQFTIGDEIMPGEEK